MLLALLLAACGPAADDTALADSTEPIPAGTHPCAHPELWPWRLPAEDGRFTVHYREEADAGTAEEVAEVLARSFQVEVDELGFRPPLPDDGLCGPDGGFDLFLWRGIETCYADVIAPDPETPWDDYASYIALDAWGPYGGEMLDSTVAHELNHACQAADDWWDAPIVFEMTSAFVEDAVFDDDDTYRSYFADFQARPEWSLDRDDGYRTWYMYGASMYFFFLRDRYFEGDFSWVSDLWFAMRSGPGAAEDPALDEPDFEDALEGLLQERAGAGFLDSALEFARWRWYTGARDDGAHFEEGAAWPDDAGIVPVPLAPGEEIEVHPMPLGNAYLELRGRRGEELVLTLRGEGARLVLQALPGLEPGSDGELLGEGEGEHAVTLGADGRRIAVLTALPEGVWDADIRDDSPLAVTVALELGG